jgi:sterol desaturase/sphingolipid hydroxylase (fatty acid hydroxylase superfamily)
VDSSDRVWKAALGGGGVALNDLLWYAGAAGVLWLAFHVLLRRRMERRRILTRVADGPQVRREVIASLRSIVVFGIVAALVVFAALGGHTRLYPRVEEHGWAWFFASIALAVAVHDAYFYWTHRLIHHPRLFRRVHRAHHRSTSPTPWAAYSFGVMEAFVQAGIGPLVVCTIPMHPAAFLLFMTWQVSFNVFGHCGYEIFPRWFLDTWAGRVLNTPTHHALHHEKFRGNYGLYFNVWDRLMGTNHPDYRDRFVRAAGGTDDPPETADAGVPAITRFVAEPNLVHAQMTEE